MATWTGKSRWRRVAITVSAMAVVLLVAASFRFVQSRGMFASVEEKAPGQCHDVFSGWLVRAHDVVLDPVSKTAYFTFSSPHDLPMWPSGLYAISYEKPGPFPIRLTQSLKYFRPTALGFYRAPDGTAYLRVINEPEKGRYSISLFQVAGLKAQEIGRLTTDALNDPAAITMVDQERFYLVNRHKTHTALGRWLDDAFLLPRANVLYFDGMKFITVAERLNSPSGIALSPDGSHLYVGQDLPRALASFSRSEFSGALDNSALLGLPAGPRKIMIAPDGSLIVAARPKAGTGAVYRVRLDNGAPQAAELLYATKSHEITAAAEAGGHLLIGSDQALIDCKP